MKKQELVNSLMNKMSNPNININPTSNENSINKGHNSSYLNPNSLNGKANNNNNNIKRPMTSKIPISSYITQDHSVPTSTKEKIKDLFCQIEEPKRMMSNKENLRLIPNPNLNPYPNTNTHIKHYNSNSISRPGADKKKDFNSLEAFSDFTYKSPIEIKERNRLSPMNIDTMGNNKNNNTTNCIINKTEYPIKANDIRSITNKIRFLSSDEAKGLDRNLLDELSNLRQVLNKLFDSKLKAKAI